MKQDDYFLNQIDLLGRILGKVIADLLLLNSPDNILQIDSINEAFKNGLDLDLEEIKDLPDDEFLQKLLENHKINIENIEKIAEILSLLSEKTNSDYSKKELLLLEYIQANSTTYSTERIKKIELLKQQNGF